MSVGEPQAPLCNSLHICSLALSGAAGTTPSLMLQLQRRGKWPKDPHLGQSGQKESVVVLALTSSRVRKLASDCCRSSGSQGLGQGEGSVPSVSAQRHPLHCRLG